MNLKEAFFQDLAHSLTLWSGDMIRAIADPSTAAWVESKDSLARLHESCSEENNGVRHFILSDLL